MSKTRVSKKVVSNVTAEQFEEAMSHYAVADAKEAKINATMDERITKIREQFATDLAQCAETKTNTLEVIQKYCEENQEELFTKKKSMETVHGVVGFRTGTPALKTMKGFTWASVLTLAKTIAPKFIRTKDELDKEQLLSNRDQEEVKALMPKLGVEVKQDESFFIELKKEMESVQ